MMPLSPQPRRTGSNRTANANAAIAVTIGGVRPASAVLHRVRPVGASVARIGAELPLAQSLDDAQPRHATIGQQRCGRGNEADDGDDRGDSGYRHRWRARRRVEDAGQDLQEGRADVVERSLTSQPSPRRSLRRRAASPTSPEALARTNDMRSLLVCETRYDRFPTRNASLGAVGNSRAMPAIWKSTSMSLPRAS